MFDMKTCFPIVHDLLLSSYSKFSCGTEFRMDIEDMGGCGIWNTTKKSFKKKHKRTR